MLDLFCLSLVVYVEARGEPIDGQLMVAEVAINRTQVDRFPDDVCGVVFDPDQFAGITTDLNMREIFHDPAWKQSVAVATNALSGNTVGTEATHFHTTNTNPYWSNHLTKLGQYGNHIFYVEEN